MHSKRGNNMTEKKKPSFQTNIITIVRIRFQRKGGVELHQNNPTSLQLVESQNKYKIEWLFSISNDDYD